jgi:ankyrin repeat protein
MTNLKRCIRFIVYLIAVFAFSSVQAQNDNADFFTAASRDDARALMNLMVRGVNPNQRDGDGQTALMVAIREEAWKAVDSLLEYKALDINAANKAGETALMMAALRGNLDVLKKLLVRGALNSLQQPGWTALHYAASSAVGGDCVALLAKEGAELNARSPNGTTPLMMAARYGSEPAVESLLKAGADKTLRNEKGLSAADFARDGGRPFLLPRLQ